MDNINNQDDELLQQAKDIVAETEQTVKDIAGLTQDLEASQAAKAAIEDSIKEVESTGDVDQAEATLKNKLTEIDEKTETDIEHLNQVHEDTQKDLWREQAGDQE